MRHTATADPCQQHRSIPQPPRIQGSVISRKIHYDSTGAVIREEERVGIHTETQVLQRAEIRTLQHLSLEVAKSPMTQTETLLTSQEVQKTQCSALPFCEGIRMEYL